MSAVRWGNCACDHLSGRCFVCSEVGITGEQSFRDQGADIEITEFLSHHALPEPLTVALTAVKIPRSSSQSWNCARSNWAGSPHARSRMLNTVMRTCSVVPDGKEPAAASKTTVAPSFNVQLSKQVSHLVG